MQQKFRRFSLDAFRSNNDLPRIGGAGVIIRECVRIDAGRDVRIGMAEPRGYRRQRDTRR